MRFRYLALPALLLVGVVALSLTHGQDARPTPPPSGVVPATYKEPAPATATEHVRPVSVPKRDLSKLSDTQKQALLTAQRGAMWLFRMNTDSGRFYYGFLPALNRPMEDDSFLHQAAAAATLARAARVTGDERFMARAAQAILLLLVETTVDPKDTQVRYTTTPSLRLNRVAAAGILIAAINELPAPPADLLEKSEQLCNFLRRQARADGSLCVSEPGDDGKPIKETFDAVNEYPGLALHGVMLSQRHRPAAWKTDLARKAVAYYHRWWKANKNMAFIPEQTAAYTEAYLLTKEPAFAACVLEMNDWLCERQYERPPQSWWFGGFMAWKDGHSVEDAPAVGCAVYGASLGCACRVAHQTADSNRYDRYTLAVERNLQFLSGLQYTTSNTRHYEEDYRQQWLCGGFHPSNQDGNLRLDYTQQAVAAMLQYVESR